MDMLNENQKMPRFLVVVLDRDLIQDVIDIQEDKSLMKDLNVIVNWITRQIEILLRRKHLQLMEKKGPRAVVEADQTTIIYIMMLHRIEQYQKGSYLECLCRIRPKFNDMLNEAVAIKDIELCSRIEDFNHKVLYPLGQEKILGRSRLPPRALQEE